MNIELIKNHRIKDVKDDFGKRVRIEKHVCRYSMAIYQYYQNYMQQKHMIDFTDMLLLTYNLFKEKSDVLDYYRDLYRYIMVDEYQDTNTVQFLLVKSFLQRNIVIFVLSEMTTSLIYKFRGANIYN